MTLPVLAGYKINNALASGGMAKIYDAVQISLNRPVAIKFLSKQLLSHSEAKELFERESLIIAQLHHPNIVQIYDKGISEDSQPFFVMEKIIGIDLALMLSDGELPINKKFDIAIQICKGLAYAHKNGVIHRDIKPSNIIIDQHGDAKILDFGIAFVGDEDASSESPTTVVGTAGYVAPEQHDNYNKATVASDIYSVGVVFFDLFGLPTSDTNKVNPDRLKELKSKSLVALINKCCSHNPADRFESLTEVRDELLRISQGSHLGQTNIKAAASETKDLSSSFNLLDVLSRSNNKRVYLFQKKSNKQLLIIRRLMGEVSGLKEAKLLTSLKHPNIANIFAAAQANDNATIISEYLSGGSLAAQLIQDFDENHFLEIAIKIASAIDFAHQNNLLHGNLLPNNIIFDDKQNPKICDFGVKHDTNDQPELAKTYLPPGDKKITEQYDIYCLGAIFHHMLFGVPPSIPLPPTAPKVSFRLEKLVDHMLAIDPQHRIQSAQEVYVELLRIYNADVNRAKRSKMGEGRDEDLPIASKRKKVRKVKSGDDSLWLYGALGIAIGVIILLVILLIFK
ncbi:protein kinase [Aliikangiella marina]|uniref:Protein kinase n=1 Tax=Aliikangiella marina TaxID=1712262 RepID=A0A545T6M9_9GAMM|nr:protein kinase [Aliikangiella marina]TQV72881.1 protein kinase [Aliikangiella marina]